MWSSLSWYITNSLFLIVHGLCKDFVLVTFEFDRFSIDSILLIFRMKSILLNFINEAYVRWICV